MQQYLALVAPCQSMPREDTKVRSNVGVPEDAPEAVPEVSQPAQAPEAEPEVAPEAVPEAALGEMGGATGCMTVCVGNLPREINQKEIKKHFSCLKGAGNQGKVTRVRMFDDPVSRLFTAHLCTAR